MRQKIKESQRLPEAPEPKTPSVDNTYRVS